MNIFGGSTKIFGGAVSNKEIDRTVITHFEKYMDSFEYMSDNDFLENYQKMIESLRRWSDKNNLSMWKRSRIIGDIKSTLTRMFANSATPNKVIVLIKKADSLINSEELYIE